MTGDEAVGVPPHQRYYVRGFDDPSYHTMWWFVVILIVPILRIGITVEPSIQDVCGSKGPLMISSTKAKNSDADAFPTYTFMDSEDSEDLYMAMKTIMLHALIEYPLGNSYQKCQPTCQPSSLAPNNKNNRTPLLMLFNCQWTRPSP